MFRHNFALSLRLVIACTSFRVFPLCIVLWLPKCSQCVALLSVQTLCLLCGKRSAQRSPWTLPLSPSGVCFASALCGVVWFLEPTLSFLGEDFILEHSCQSLLEKVCMGELRYQDACLSMSFHLHVTGSSLANRILDWNLFSFIFWWFHSIVIRCPVLLSF